MGLTYWVRLSYFEWVLFAHVWKCLFVRSSFQRERSARCQMKKLLLRSLLMMFHVMSLVQVSMNPPYSNHLLVFSRTHKQGSLCEKTQAWNPVRVHIFLEVHTIISSTSLSNSLFYILVMLLFGFVSLSSFDSWSVFFSVNGHVIRCHVIWLIVWLNFCDFKKLRVVIRLLIDVMMGECLRWWMFEDLVPSHVRSTAILQPN